MVFTAVQGDGQTVTLNCPALVCVADEPATQTTGWQAVNAGCCTVLTDGEFTLTITGSLFGAGAMVALAVTCAGDYATAVRCFKLAFDDWAGPEGLAQFNAEIEALLADYLAPSGWRKG